MQNNMDVGFLLLLTITFSSSYTLTAMNAPNYTDCHLLQSSFSHPTINLTETNESLLSAAKDAHLHPYDIIGAT